MIKSVVKRVPASVLLEQAIARAIGTNKGMVKDFKDVVIATHLEMESKAVQMNCCLRAVVEAFGIKPHVYATMCSKIRKGSDADGFKAFDEMAEYAAKNFPNVVSPDNAWDDFVGLVNVGIQKIPAVHHDSIIAKAITTVGPEWFAGYDKPVAPAKREGEVVADDKVEKTIVRLSAYIDAIAKSIKDELEGAPAIGWPKYRLSRLRNEIKKLPEWAQQVATERTRLAECEKMVENRFACHAFE